MSRLQSACGWAAAASCTAAVVLGGARLDGFSHAVHPPALLGASGVPGALAFNIAGFIVPGLLAAIVALGLYRTLPAAAGWLPRIGARMLLLSALAFAAQGLLSLDPADMDGHASGLHAAGLPRTRIATLAAASVLLATMFVPPSLLEPPYAQRTALAAWLLWLAIAPWQAGGLRSPE